MKIISGFSVEVTPKMVLKRLIEMGPKVSFENVSKRTLKDIDKFLEKSRSWIKPRGIYEIFNCQVQENQIILNHGEGILTSAHLAKVFRNNEKVGLYIVTIGKDLEKNMEYYFGRREMPIIDAIGSAAISQWEFYVYRQIIYPLLVPSGNLSTFRRYPGVGDWSIKDQKVIFKLLGSEETIERLIGVTLTTGFLMNPNKSISAIVGVKSPRL